MKRKRSQAVIERDKILLSEIQEIKAEHPLWGHLRVWSYLKFREGLEIN